MSHSETNSRDFGVWQEGSDGPVASGLTDNFPNFTVELHQLCTDLGMVLPEAHQSEYSCLAKCLVPKVNMEQGQNFILRGSAKDITGPQRPVTQYHNRDLLISMNIQCFQSLTRINLYLKYFFYLHYTIKPNCFFNQKDICLHFKMLKTSLHTRQHHQNTHSEHVVKVHLLSKCHSISETIFIFMYFHNFMDNI